MDENRPDNIDKLFTDSLQPSKREPPKEIWENIEQELDSDDRHASFVRLRFAYIISACLLALVACLWLFSSKVHSDRIASSDHSRPVETDKTVAKGRNLPGGANSPIGEVHTVSAPDSYVETTNRHHNDPRTVSPFGQTATDDDAEFVQSAAALRFTRPTPSSLTRGNPAMGGVRLAVLKFDARQPDPNQLLLKQQTSKFTKITPDILQRRPGRWAATAYFSKELAGYTLSDHDSVASNGSEVDKKEKPIYSASAVVLADYILSWNWTLQSGFSYSWSNSLANPTTSYVVSNNGQLKYRINTVSGYGYLPVTQSVPTRVGDSVLTGKSFTKLHYFSMPFIVSYKFRLRKFTLMTGMGFTLNLLTSAKLATKIQGASFNQDEVEVKMYGLKRMNYGAVIKAELQYPIYKNWSLDLVASFKNTLTPINLHTVITTYPYNLGIGLGISHNF